MSVRDYMYRLLEAQNPTYAKVVEALSQWPRGWRRAPSAYDPDKQDGWTIMSGRQYEGGGMSGAYDVYYYVDHVGKGGKAAMSKYLRALQRAGLDARMGPVTSYQKKQVIWIYDTKLR